MTDFQDKVYCALKLIPRGKVTTYGFIAHLVGCRGARAVGNALHANPFPVVIPCHRVLNAKGELAKAFVFGGADVQKSLLESEGVTVCDGKVDLDKFGWFSDIKSE